MNIRERIERNERKLYLEYASFSSKSRGRRMVEDKCQLRTDFQRDRDRIIHSKAFRRLKHKTQVFISPEGDHFRTRLTHTLEVAQIARTIGRALGLNEDLIEAIALGHDLGHTPFGHGGEKVLNDLRPGGFKHNLQSLRVVDFLENKKGSYGLNLTYEVREGIINHSGASEPKTLEAKVVKYSDRIAYINHDIDDSIRAGLISKKDLPKESISLLGEENGERINNMILSLVRNSYLKDDISMEEEYESHMDQLRDFLFERVYLSERAYHEEKKVRNILTQIFNHYKLNIDFLPSEHLSLYREGTSKDIIVTDYIAGMTDRFAINLYKNNFIPSSWAKY